MLVYLILSILFQLFMFMLWSKQTLLNIVIKFLVFLLAMFGIALVIANYNVLSYLR